MNKKYLKVMDHKNLVRDSNSKAILNNDLGELADFETRRAKEREKLKRDIEEQEFRIKTNKILEEHGMEIMSLKSQILTLQEFIIRNQQGR
jgi:hypothetical protein